MTKGEGGREGRGEGGEGGGGGRRGEGGGGREEGGGRRGEGGDGTVMSPPRITPKLYNGAFHCPRH